MPMSITRPLLAGVSYFSGRTEKGLVRFRTNTNVWPCRDVRTRHLVDISKRPSQEGLALQHGRSVTKFEDSTDNEVEEQDATWKVTPLRDIESGVDKVRSMLESMNDGEINISAYDTAWVALVEDIDGREQPQFPAAIEWIAENQLEGITFLKENISKLEDEDEAHMPSGFENTLQALMEIARDVEIKIPFDHPVLQEIYARRKIKFNRITKEMLHEVPTTLLNSLEGIQMEGMKWEKILRMQCDDGSFLSSPSSTAFALMRTRDHKCLDFLNHVTRRFNGGAPVSYPIEVYERLWVIDRLQRLGISRYFKEKLDELMAYVSRLWTNNGLGWTRFSTVCDIDDTSMGFRLLRLYGHQVSPEAFEKFKSDDKFFTFAGETTESVTPMHNLYRASQLRFPGETILEDANNYASKFLTETREADDWSDKWIIAKGLPSEVGYALDVPFYASLPRLVTRFYLEQYGGNSDVWLAKAYYRFSRFFLFYGMK